MTPGITYDDATSGTAAVTAVDQVDPDGSDDAATATLTVRGPTEVTVLVETFAEEDRDPALGLVGEEVGRLRREAEAVRRLAASDGVRRDRDAGQARQPEGQAGSVFELTAAADDRFAHAAEEVADTGARGDLLRELLGGGLQLGAQVGVFTGSDPGEGLELTPDEQATLVAVVLVAGAGRQRWWGVRSAERVLRTSGWTLSAAMNRSFNLLIGGASALLIALFVVLLISMLLELWQQTSLRAPHFSEILFAARIRRSCRCARPATPNRCSSISTSWIT